MNYILQRINDNKIISATKLSFIEWDENDKGKALHDNIQLNYSCLLGSRNMFYTWLTTTIVEILEDNLEFKHFKTKNSEYKLYITEKEITDILDLLVGEKPSDDQGE